MSCSRMNVLNEAFSQQVMLTPERSAKERTYPKTCPKPLQSRAHTRFSDKLLSTIKNLFSIACAYQVVLSRVGCLVVLSV